MRHIQIYEDYSDDELEGLLGDMRSVGQSRVNLDIDYGPYHGMGEKEKEGERNIADNWSFEIPGGEDVRVKSGSIKVSPKKITRVVLNMTNGDVLELETDNKVLRTESFSINGEFPDPLQKSSWVMEDPGYTVDALTRYEHYLINKHKIGEKPPTFFQRLKKKIGLDESEYSEDELKALLGDMRSVGQSLTEEEEDMLQFVNQFGGGMSAEDYAETLYDYYKNPGDYDIDPEGDYYDMIWYLYENSVEDHARFDLQGPMRMSMSPNWNIDGISNEPLYKMYLKMSGHYNKNKK